MSYQHVNDEQVEEALHHQHQQAQHRQRQLQGEEGNQNKLREDEANRQRAQEDFNGCANNTSGKKCPLALLSLLHFVEGLKWHLFRAYLWWRCDDEEAACLFQSATAVASLVDRHLKAEYALEMFGELPYKRMHLFSQGSKSRNGGRQQEYPHRLHEQKGQGGKGGEHFDNTTTYEDFYYRQMKGEGGRPVGESNVFHPDHFGRPCPSCSEDTLPQLRQETQQRTRAAGPGDQANEDTTIEVEEEDWLSDNEHERLAWWTSVVERYLSEQPMTSGCDPHPLSAAVSQGIISLQEAIEKVVVESLLLSDGLWEDDHHRQVQGRERAWLETRLQEQLGSALSFSTS
ncbi:unnamed protein product [Amoebophrya sp. A25]|nr:unnamed protein product [Amoebophrya sp. A25]|eukprot:GSA25T00006529001.1